jgi:CheY-like chemotaxis protein
VHNTRLKLDEVFKEIETGTQQARERLLEVFLERAADPAHALEHAKERVADLASQYKQRLERVRNLMIDHEKALLQSVERDHHDRARKLYRSLVYMMQKLGVRYQHRAPMLQMVAYFAQLGADDVQELQHSALLGIYEDLVRQVYVAEGPSKDSLALLEKTRQDFGISEDEHRELMGHAKDALLVAEYQPTVAVIEGDPSLAKRIAEAIALEFPKVVVKLFNDPESFLKAVGDALPDILISATLFDQSAMQGLDLMRKVKQLPVAKERFTETVLMIPATDEYFQEAIRTHDIGQIVQKPFSNELLMWTLRPLIFKASGTRVDMLNRT